jgi:predicted dehydrogenase
MTVKWGIIGCGDVVLKKSAPSFQHAEGAKIVAAADKDRERAEAFGRQFGVSRTYFDAEDLLSDPEVDAVYIATPPNLHYPHVIAAARMRKHVLCEKPMALTVTHCREMIEACDRSGVKLMVAYYRRFWPQTLLMKRLIEEGEIGEVVSARTQMTGNVMFEPEPVRRWKLNPAVSGGGFLMDVGCHRIDLLMFLIGEVQDVTAFTDRVNWEYEVDNSSSFILRFRRGALATGSFNWTVNYFSDDFEIIGTQAKIIASPFGGDKIYLQRHKETKEIATPSPAYTHAGLIAQANEVIEQGAIHSISGDLGLRVSQVIEAAYLSSKERRTVSLAELS